MMTDIIVPNGGGIKMKTVTLNIAEIIAVLDPLNQDAYDRLQQALEAKAIAVLGGDEWLEVWNSDEWTVNLNLNFNDEVIA
jgi:hypothetical protein